VPSCKTVDTVCCMYVVTMHALYVITGNKIPKL